MMVKDFFALPSHLVRRWPQKQKGQHMTSFLYVVWPPATNGNCNV
jgi:hypothetical protein